MGNRATIEVVSDGLIGTRTYCYIYLHWHGSPENVKEFVRNAAPKMRMGDVSYATARLIAEICNNISGGLSVGVLPALEKEKETGDNGHYIIDMHNGRILNNYKIIDSDIEFGNF